MRVEFTDTDWKAIIFAMQGIAAGKLEMNWVKFADEIGAENVETAKREFDELVDRVKKAKDIKDTDETSAEETKPERKRKSARGMKTGTKKAF